MNEHFFNNHSIYTYFLFFSCVESMPIMRNSIKAESMNHTSHSSFQEKMSPEFAYEREEIIHHNNSNSIETSPVGANHSSFAAKFQDSYEQGIPEPEPFAETPTGSSSSKEHFSPKCAFAPPCPTRGRCERPTAIRMLPKGGKSRVRKHFSLLKYTVLGS